MFDRFTDRAKKVMNLARQEAQRFNHEYLGTEHVLLGLVQEGSGVAANVLRNMGIDLAKIRSEVEKLVKTGPNMVTMGQLPFTPRAKKVIEYSMEEARNLNHNYVGTEHILLGLLREQEGVAAQVLMNLGLKLDEVREEVFPNVATLKPGGGYIFATVHNIQADLPVPLPPVIHPGTKEPIGPDDLVVAMVGERLAREDAQCGYILDGFPRTVAQAEALDALLERIGQPVDEALQIDVDEDAVVERIAKRAALEGRSDDTEETVRNRLKVYGEQTAPVVDFYAQKGILSRVLGDGTIEEVFQRIKGVLQINADG